MTPRFSLQLSLVFTVSMLSLLSGCSTAVNAPEKPTGSATVSGTVSFNKKPVTGCSIVFYSSQFGDSHQAKLNDAGKFSFADPISPGEYVLFCATDSGKTLSNPPQKYWSDTSSDYMMNVKESDNILTIDFKKE